MSEFAIRLQGVAKAYSGKVALFPIDMSFSKNCIYGIIGRNGSGKSTLIKLIADLEQPCLGQVYMAKGASIGYVSSDESFPSKIAITDIATLFEASKNTWLQCRFEDVLSIFELSPSMKFGDLSTGQKAGVKLATMLAQKKSIWLIDEATLGIDIVAQSHALTALLKYFIEDQPCVLYCTHDINEIERLADELLILEQGQLGWHGAKDVLAETNQSLSESIFTFLQKFYKAEPNNQGSLK